MNSNWMYCLSASIAFAVGAAAAAEATRPGDKPLVVNGDLSMTTLDFDAYMERVPAEHRSEFRADYEKLNPTVDALWVRRVLAAKARAAGMDKDPVAQARVRLAEDDVLAEIYLTDVANKVKIPALEARALELYKGHPKDFATPENITAGHILVSTKTYPREQALARAQEAYQRAKAGEDFEKLAEEFTDNKTSIHIEKMALANLVKPLPDVVRKLKPGEVMPPTETQFGFHVIKLQEYVPKGVRAYEEVREELIAMEKQKVIDEAKTAEVEAIRGDPKTTLYVENVRGLKSDFKYPTGEEAKKIKPRIRY